MVRATMTRSVTGSDFATKYVNRAGLWVVYTGEDEVESFYHRPNHIPGFHERGPYEVSYILPPSWIKEFSWSPALTQNELNLTDRAQDQFEELRGAPFIEPVSKLATPNCLTMCSAQV